MANPFILTPQLASGFLNNEDNTIAGKTATGAPINLPAQAYSGQLGKVVSLDDAEALKLSKTSIGTLRQGSYQMVITKAASATAPARGGLCFWDTQANNGLGKYTVTPDATATNISQVAGVYLNAPTKGNYTWIQVAGLANMLFAGAGVDTTIGDVVYVDSTPTNTVKSATAALVTLPNFALAVGTAYTAPAISTISLVWIAGGNVITLAL